MAGTNRTLNVKIQFTAMTTAQWAEQANADKVLSKGAMAVEFTTDGKTLLKVGDGVKKWSELPYTGAEVTLDADAITDALGFTPVDAADVGVAEGVASLDAAGKVPEAQLPSYVDDVIEGYYDVTAGKMYKEEAKTTEITGEAGKIYVDIPTGKTYRWGGTQFVEISSGATIDTALSNTSENPVQNKVIEAALADKIDINDTLVFNCEV